jgi:hypothetical protein
VEVQTVAFFIDRRAGANRGTLGDLMGLGYRLRSPGSIDVGEVGVGGD